MRIDIQEELKERRWEERSKICKQNVMILSSISALAFISAVVIEMIAFDGRWAILATFQESPVSDHTFYASMLFIVLLIFGILFGQFSIACLSCAKSNWDDMRYYQAEGKWLNEHRDYAYYEDGILVKLSDMPLEVHGKKE